MKTHRLGWSIVITIFVTLNIPQISFGQSGTASQEPRQGQKRESRRLATFPGAKSMIETKGQERPSTHPFSFIPENEVKVKTSYVFESDLRRGTIPEGKVAAVHFELGYVATPNLNEDFQFRTGFEIDRTSFSYNQSNTVPNTLEGANLVLGFDWALYQDWLIRFEARPGIYTTRDDFDSSSFNTTFLLGASYFVNRDLNWLFGVTVNPWRDIPIIPGVGVRWAFAKNWQLNLMFPNPRIEYRVAPGIKIYAGGEWKSGSYRTDKNFGDSHGDVALNNAILDYREIRAGAGLILQPNDIITLELQTGAMLDRRYDYFRADKQIHSDMAPYMQLGASFRF